ncbi:cobalamin-dependent protein [Allokutzneria sp. NRRL B-24872]|uniref:cobalamin-dependent protein n=1 Tax=Allokutzneria sp. NRRL B-24872 TaxID=1137961 RepID=UPI0011782B6A|nr:cobalamin-dependent protein [Allokutzneria sp. NRRL B-24872]
MTRVVVAGGAGADPLARALRDAGFEVVHIGESRDPAQVAAAVVQEDAVAVGFTDVPAESVEELRDLLVAQGAEDVVLFRSGAEPGEIVESLTGADPRPSDATRTT